MPAQAPAAPVPNVVVPPAVSEVPIVGTSSLFDVEVTPMWPAKPGVYVRGVHTREVGQAQFNRISGGARSACAFHPCTIHTLHVNICMENGLHGSLSRLHHTFPACKDLPGTRDAWQPLTDTCQHWNGGIEHVLNTFSKTNNATKN